MITETPTFASGVWLDDDNPWPGLLPFGEEDWKYFRGRDFEADMLYRKVQRERLTVLFAPSGLGKSSLLRAGLFPILRRENFLPVYIRLDFSPNKPDLAAQVKSAIVREAERSKVDAPTRQPKETLWEYFHRRDANFWSERHQVLTPILVFDQFEEVFTLGARDRARSQATSAFLLELSDVVEARPPLQLRARLEMESPEKESSEAKQFNFERHRYKVLLTLREDFLPDLEALADKMGSVSHNRFRLGRMNGIAALQAVNQAPAIITPEVAERVVRFVAAAEPHAALVDLEVEPALLSVVCGELNSQRQERREAQITERALEGSQNQILADFYERSIADLSEEVCTFVEEKLLTRRGFRNLVVYEEAVTTPGITEDDVEELVRRRLIHVEERGRRRLLELSHDLLTGVVAASREERRRRAKEAEAVKKLEARHRRVLRRAAGLFLVFVLALVALGAFAWAYLAQQQADVLAQAKESAERAAEEASAQRAIAEARRLEAEREHDDAERARELAELAAAEASRQQQIADAEREEAVRQGLEAVQARSDAERAFDDALLQKNLADEQRRIAEARQREVEESQRQLQQTNFALVEALRERLSSRDAGEVLGALDILVLGTQDSDAVLARIGSSWFQSPREFVTLLVGLDETASSREAALRNLLVKRFAAEKGLSERAPHADSVERVPIEAGVVELDGRPVEVPSFLIQRYEVRNDEYRRFDPTHDRDAPGEHPVTNVSWYEAMAYAAWLGGSLPTEAQWQLAARGTGGRAYPWGNSVPTPTRANYRWSERNPAPAPVGSFPDGATPNGIHDLAGNVWEWCRDEFSPNARILKGGSFFNDERYLAAEPRNLHHPDEGESVVGFRVVWPNEPAAAVTPDAR